LLDSSSIVDLSSRVIKKIDDSFGLVLPQCYEKQTQLTNLMKLLSQLQKFYGNPNGPFYLELAIGDEVERIIALVQKQISLINCSKHIISMLNNASASDTIDTYIWKDNVPHEVWIDLFESCSLLLLTQSDRKEDILQFFQKSLESPASNKAVFKKLENYFEGSTELTSAGTIFTFTNTHNYYGESISSLRNLLANVSSGKSHRKTNLETIV